MKDKSRHRPLDLSGVRRHSIHESARKVLGRDQATVTEPSPQLLEFLNVVERPTRLGGRGFNFTGHHELLVPLLHAGLRCHAELKSRK